MYATPNDFSLAIETRSVEGGITCVEAILEMCEELDIDPEDVSGMVNKSLREKLAQEFREMNYLPQQASLDW